LCEGSGQAKNSADTHGIGTDPVVKGFVHFTMACSAPDAEELRSVAMADAVVVNIFTGRLLTRLRVCD
jgi:hypothetical protein